MNSVRWRLQIAITRVATRVLKRFGWRESVIRWREDRQLSQRAAAEAQGDDRLSKPALHELDAKLNAIINRDSGFFVEAGAHDGFTQSNTYWLEHFRHWTGLLVEPMSTLATKAKRIRPGATVVQCALIAAGDSRTQLRMRFGDLMSMVDGAREAGWPGLGTILGWHDPYEADVDARTLSALLDDINAPQVDLLSLDVEGFEAEALRGLDLERHAPCYVLVEMHDRERNKPPVDAVLSAYYVEHGWLSPLDLLYVRRDLAESNAAVAGSAG